MLNVRRIGGPLVAALLLVTLSATMAMAQSPLGIGSAEPSFQTTGIFGGFFAWVNAEQQSFYRMLTGALKGMRENPWQLWSLIGLSFTYGVFHAAGPGHGKAVISSYMIANETELRRGVLLSFLSSILQGVVAILLIGAVYLVLRGSSINMTLATCSSASCDRWHDRPSRPDTPITKTTAIILIITMIMAMRTAPARSAPPAAMPMPPIRKC
jgi:nickel/cobalt transporter (NicO) family protein